MVELMIFSAIFSLAALAFLSTLVYVGRIQARQSAQAEVAGQSQYLLQTIQRYVEQSSVVENDTNPTNLLKLRTSSSTEDSVQIYLSGTTVYIQKKTAAGATTVNPLTSSKVNVTSLSFQKKQNSGASGQGHDSVNVSFMMTFNSPNTQWQFANAFQTTVARVSAATFDSNVSPNTGGSLTLGDNTYSWKSINNVLYFNGSNVGIGVSAPGAPLEVNGGIKMNPTAQPACNSGSRGTLWVSQNGTTDELWACLSQSGTSTWVKVK